MPSKDAVWWINNKGEIASKISKVIYNRPNIDSTIKWYELIVGPTPFLASEKIWEAIALIERKCNLFKNDES